MPQEATDARWVREVVFFIGGQLSALIGSSIVAYTITWYITLKTGSGTQYAALIIASQLTQGLMAIPGGIWADRYWRKGLIIGADAALAIVTLGMVVMFALGHEQLWLIVVMLALRGLGAGVQGPAVSASLPQLVPKGHLMRVNSINSAAQAVVFVGAPAIAAAMLNHVPLDLIMLIDVAATIVAIGLLLMVRLPRLERVTSQTAPVGWRSYVHDTAEGVRSLAAHPGLVRAVIIFAVLQCVLIPVANLTPVFITRYFGDATWMLAAAEIFWSGGMVIGGLIMATWGGMRNRMTLVMLTSASWVVLTALMGASPDIWFFCAIMIISGTLMPFLTTNTVTGAQERIAPQVLGRVMSLFTLIMAVSGPIGLAVFGWLADAVSLRLLCFVAASLTGIFLLVLQLRGGPGSQLIAVEKAESHELA